MFVDFNITFRVMRSFQFPGYPPVKQEVIQLLFDLCSFRMSYNRSGAAVHVPILNEEGRKVASPSLLVKVCPGYIFEDFLFSAVSNLINEAIVNCRSSFFAT